MKKLLLIFFALMLVLCAACAMDTPVERSGLKYNEVCEWTKREWSAANEAERIEALYLMIDENNDKVDAGTSAQVSLEGFNKAFSAASEDTTLKQIFDASSPDEVTYDAKDEKK